MRLNGFRVRPIRPLSHLSVRQRTLARRPAPAALYLRAQEDSNLRPLDPQSSALSRLSYGHESARRRNAAPSERVGFEPTVPLRIQLLSREPDSTTLAPLPGVHTGAEAMAPAQGVHRLRDTGWPLDAEREGFEPPELVTQRFSRPPPSTTRTPLRSVHATRATKYRRPPPGCQIPPEAAEAAAAAGAERRRGPAASALGAGGTAVAGPDRSPVGWRLQLRVRQARRLVLRAACHVGVGAFRKT